MITLDKLSFAYGKKTVLRDFSLTVNKGEIVGIMGPSGCGKSTLLGLVAGLKKPKSGSVRVDTERISYVFQEPRLLPWMTVWENLAAVLSEKPDCEDPRIIQALAMAGLEGCEGLYPHELSGGMKSRASLARALLYDGELFLLDEPFASLDEALRRELTERLTHYFRENGTTVLYVTHHAEDAKALCDRILHL